MKDLREVRESVADDLLDRGWLAILILAFGLYLHRGRRTVRLTMRSDLIPRKLRRCGQSVEGDGGERACTGGAGESVTDLLDCGIQISLDILHRRAARRAARRPR